MSHTDHFKDANDNVYLNGQPLAQLPQETGIDILERYFRKYTATPQGINLSEIDEAFEKSKVNAAQALLRLIEEKVIGKDEPIELDYADYPKTKSLEAHGRNQLRAEQRSKLRELLGGAE